MKHSPSRMPRRGSQPPKRLSCSKARRSAQHRPMARCRTGRFESVRVVRRVWVASSLFPSSRHSILQLHLNSTPGRSWSVCFTPATCGLLFRYRGARAHRRIGHPKRTVRPASVLHKVSESLLESYDVG